MVDRLCGYEDFHYWYYAQIEIFQDCLNSAVVDRDKVAKFVMAAKRVLEVLCKVGPHVPFFVISVVL